MARALWVLSLACLVVAEEVRAAARATPPATAPESTGWSPRGDVCLSRWGVGFVENAGRFDRSVRAWANCPGYELFLADREAVLSFAGAAPLRLAFAGVATTSASGERPGRVHFLRGNDASQYVRNARHFDVVTQRGVAEGVDLAWRLDGAAARVDVHVGPGTPADAFALTLHGARDARIDVDGTLVVRTGGGELRATPPVAWEEEGRERRAVGARWRVLAGNRVGFAVDSRDPRRALVIDPTLEFAAVVGGSGHESPTVSGRSVAVGPGGAVYAVGTTPSSDFPASAGAFDTTLTGGKDGVVVKLDPQGALAYATLLGGTQSSVAEYLEGVAVDSSGSAYVTGWTTATDFPTTPGALDTTASAGGDAIVAKLAPAGDALAWSTYLGGSGGDSGTAIALQPGGSIPYVAGATNSPDFPAKSSIDPPGAVRNAFVAKLAGDGGSLTYATLFLVDVGNPALDLVVDEDGAAHVSGRVESDDFPATAGAFRETRPGGLDGFVCKIVPAGNEFAFATWKSARGALPKAALAFDPAKGKFALKLSRFDYAGVPTNPVAIDLAFGDDAGAAESAWTQRRPGLLKFPR